MKVAVIAANGRAGRLLVDEALNKGWEVTAVARGENRTRAASFLNKDLFDLTREDLAGFDAVIDAFGAWTEETVHLHETSLMHLCDVLSGTAVRLYVVGGAGSLYTDTSHSRQVMQAPDFPAAFMPLASSQGKALEALRLRNDVNWTFLSPACDFQAEGPRTGHYLWGGEELTLNRHGQSVTSYADYAIAMVELMAAGTHNRERLSVVGDY